MTMAMASASKELTIDDLIRAPAHHSRAILLALCQDRYLQNKALKHLQQLTSFEAPTQGRKRKAEHDVCVCVQCDEVFSAGDNPRGSCYYHPGELNVDNESDFWADTDENCHGPIDSEFNREEFPDGFIWDCCDKLGDSVGCAKGRHEANPVRSLKGSGETPEVSESDDDNDDEDVTEEEEEEEEEELEKRNPEEKTLSST